MAKDKKLQEPDEFLVSLQRIYKYTMENIKFIFMIGGGIVAGVLIILLILYQVKAHRDKESLLMDQGIAAYHEGRIEDAMKVLNGLSGKQGVSGAVSELYQGNILYGQGKYEDALKHFKKGQDLAEGKKIETIRGLASQGVAYTEMALKDYGKAEEAFKGMGAHFQDLSLLELARLYVSQGDSSKAKPLLDELIDSFPESSWVPAAKALKEQATGKSSG